MTTKPTQFTPGPWRIIDSRDQSKATIVGADFPAMGFVADVNLCRNNTHQQVDGRANATLIAAAPAMYEALKAMLEHEGERVYSGIGTEHDSEVLEAAKQAARAALAQAEGRQG